MKKYMNHRGAALISIIIAATFLTIIASTVLLLSYNNYASKTMSLNSKNNFYETEQNLNAVTAKIRSNINGASVSTTADLKQLINVDETNRYDCMAIAKLIYPDIENNTSYLVYGDRDKAVVTLYLPNNKKNTLYFKTNNTNSVPNFISETSTSGMIDKITIKNLTVSLETDDDYENSITTDIEFYVERTVPKSNIAGIGSFSLIMDSALTMTGNQRLNMYGNSYIADYAFDGGTSIPGSSAVELNECSQVHMMGNNNIIFGDLVLNDKSVLNVSGDNLTVIGNIQLNDEAALILNDETNLYIAEGYEITYLPTSRNNIVPMSLIDEAAPSFKVVSMSDVGIVSGLLNLNDQSRSNDGLIQAISELNIPLNAQNGEKAYFYDCGLNSLSKTESMYYDEPISCMIESEKQINENAANSLVLNFNANEITVSNPNSTILSTVSLGIGSAGNISLSTFGPDRYAYIMQKDAANPRYDSLASEMTCNIQFSKENMNWSQGSLTFRVGGFFKEETDDILNGILGIATNSSGLSTKPQTVAGYVNWKKDYDEE